jgi:hypothetical protein
MEGRTASVSHIVHRRERDRPSTPDEDPPPDAVSIEVAVPAAQIVEAMEAAIRVVKASDFFFSVPMGVRFAPPSPHFLAPSFDRATAYVEVPFNITRAKDGGEHLDREEVRDRIAKPALAAVERALRTSAALRGRPHLGKHNTMNRADLESHYPQFAKWLTAYRRFNATGVFDNAFTTQLGLTGEK